MADDEVTDVKTTVRHVGPAGGFFPRIPRGFTLIELLGVIAVVGVLAALTLSISAGARERAARDRAQTELAVLATALERYRSEYGAYPDLTADPVGLLNDLNGKLTLSGEAPNRRPFITLEGLSIDDTQTRLVDPWGQPYVYQSYQSGIRRGFHLYSMGPDGLHQSPAATGPYHENANENLDNVTLSQ